MDLNFTERLVMNNIIPDNILITEGEFIFMGLKVSHNGRGRVIITDARNYNKTYSDSDYYSPSEVRGTINNILESQ